MDSADMHSQRPPDSGHAGDSRREPELDIVAPTPGAQPPEVTKRASLREPRRVAAGISSLTQSLKFTLRETGFTRGISTWLKVNKKDGFDCQSCAWPSPDDHRHIFEFCENGVKALTSEATRKHIGPEFLTPSRRSRRIRRCAGD